VDVIVQSLLGALPSLGIYGGFAWVLVLLLRREATSEERHARELDRLNKAHDDELAEKNRDIERERERRRAAEEELAAHLRSARDTS
jgi:hypothetical protein